MHYRVKPFFVSMSNHKSIHHVHAKAALATAASNGPWWWNPSIECAMLHQGGGNRFFSVALKSYVAICVLVDKLNAPMYYDRVTLRRLSSTGATAFRANVFVANIRCHQELNAPMYCEGTTQKRLSRATPRSTPGVTWYALVQCKTWRLLSHLSMLAFWLI